MNDVSLYANYISRQHLRPQFAGIQRRLTCWPRQIRGPALKGRKMKGFGVRYFETRSSRNRSGSNLCATVRSVSVRSLR